jgi:hypothetical protein
MLEGRTPLGGKNARTTRIGLVGLRSRFRLRAVFLRAGRSLGPNDQFAAINGWLASTHSAGAVQLEELMPTFASQLSNDQLTHLAQKSVARASRKFSAGFMLAALNETDKLSDLQRRQLVEMPDFGEAVASWYGAYLFFTGGEWQRWIERRGRVTVPPKNAEVKLRHVGAFFDQRRG